MEGNGHYKPTHGQDDASWKFTVSRNTKLDPTQEVSVQDNPAAENLNYDGPRGKLGLGLY